MNTSFNYKKKTRKTTKNTNTLDYLHNKKIELINSNKKKITTHKKNLDELEKKYNTICSKKYLTESELDEKFNLYDKIQGLKGKYHQCGENVKENLLLEQLLYLPK